MSTLLDKLSRRQTKAAFNPNIVCRSTDNTTRRSEYFPIPRSLHKPKANPPAATPIAAPTTNQPFSMKLAPTAPAAALLEPSAVLAVPSLPVASPPVCTTVVPMLMVWPSETVAPSIVVPSATTKPRRESASGRMIEARMFLGIWRSRDS